MLARNLGLLGDFEASLQAAERMMALGRAIDDARLRSLAGASAGWVHVMRGDVAAGLAACRRARDEALDPVTIASALHWLAVALLEAGAPAEAVRALEESMQRYRAAGLRLAQGRSVATLSEACRLCGDLARARALAEESVRLTQDDVFGAGMAHRSLARAALELGARAEAERHAQASLGAFSTAEATFEIERARSLLAEISAPGLPSVSARG
jgi:tetratricopeptide (TPR) repeat protein